MNNITKQFKLNNVIKIYATEISSLLGLNNYEKPEVVKKRIALRNGLIKLNDVKNDETLKQLNNYNIKQKATNNIIKNKLQNSNNYKMLSNNIIKNELQNELINSSDYQNYNQNYLITNINNCVEGTVSEPETAKLLIDYYRKVLKLDTNKTYEETKLLRKATHYFYDEGKTYSITLETKNRNKYKIIGKIDGKLRIINDDYIVEMKKRVNRYYFSAREYCQIATYGFLSGINKAMLVQNLNGKLKIHKYEHDFEKIWIRKYKDDLEKIIDELILN